jgi:hypothetical protein
MKCMTIARITAVGSSGPARGQRDFQAHSRQDFLSESAIDAILVLTTR